MQKGDKVIIAECHKIPEVVGKTATVVSTENTEGDYPIIVIPDMLPPVLLGFREDELKLIGQG